MPDRRDYKQAYLACMEEIEILKVELSERHKDRVRWLRERDEARAERDALRADAERYRWLRDHPDSWWHKDNPFAPPGLGDRIDAAIDRERK